MSEFVFSPRLRVPSSEIEFRFVRSSGKGGQHVNKVSSKVQMSWNLKENQSLPPEVKKRLTEQFAGRINDEGFLRIQSEVYRDQRRNVADCLERLREILLKVEFPKKIRKKSQPTRSSVKNRLDSKKRHADKKANRKTPSDWS